ncbi:MULTISPECIES: DotD/TraH family lipoprotein [Cysteiniphilum]|uniref:Lipoprotein n=1 Tax=Cysteiniphilum litorale TaxID=2056700 RepID=A0A8J2Z2Y3_9GAMM|nr:MULTISPECIES: DotD/TraH family lipoprotein [Cysteiniphilum]GGF91575.1 hypothetical protein GCM10010995_06000 [Cysteiniphilum litorale]
MRRKARIMIISLLVVSLTSCATKPIEPESSEIIPKASQWKVTEADKKANEITKLHYFDSDVSARNIALPEIFNHKIALPEGFSGSLDNMMKLICNAINYDYEIKNNAEIPPLIVIAPTYSEKSVFEYLIEVQNQLGDKGTIGVNNNDQMILVKLF